MKKWIASVSFLLCFWQINAQVVAPCGLDYGTTQDETNIIAQMRYGTISEAIAAIDQAKNSRGNLLGCPQLALNYTPADTTPVVLADVVNIWNTVHAPAISSYTVTCPRIARYENNSALGAYFAMQAGYFQDTAKLAEIGDMMYDQQYTTGNIPNPLSRNEGVFGYVNVPLTNPCNPGGVVGSGVATLCATLPQYCVTYTGGQFSGMSFATSGQDDAANWFDGGLAYDHGWAGIQMIEAAIMQHDTLLKQKYRNSAVLAAQYAQAEYPVKNHNYTAKLIWVLAEMYAWTGDTTYRNELNYKLDKNLLPGILWDGDNDGFVDGTSPAIAFSSLTAIAQMPGRMWDGHNSLPWYQGMNTWAMTEAYVAFRDRGETDRADELKPYAVAMLDNLSSEILNLGVVPLSGNQLGVRDIAYALLNGIWKIAHYEAENHPNWEKAASAMWNEGYFNSYNTNSVDVGMYLLVYSGVPYVPLALRENFILGQNRLAVSDTKFKVYPNPAVDFLKIDFSEANNSGLGLIEIFDSTGRAVYSGRRNQQKTEISVSGFTPGVYLLRITPKNSGQYTKVFVISKK